MAKKETTTKVAAAKNVVAKKATTKRKTSESETVAPAKKAKKQLLEHYDEEGTEEVQVAKAEKPKKVKKAAPAPKEAEQDGDHEMSEDAPAAKFSAALYKPALFHAYSLREVKELVPTLDDPKLLERYLKAARKEALASDKPTNQQKMRIVERRYRQLIEEGKVFRTRRVPNTGALVTKVFTYQDNLENREKNRVGLQYEKQVWEGCEFKQVPVSRLMTKKKAAKTTEDGEPLPKRPPTAWILGLKQARDELKLEKQFIPAYNPEKLTGEPTEKQKMGIALYNLARKHQDRIQSERGERAMEEVPMEMVDASQS